MNPISILLAMKFFVCVESAIVKNILSDHILRERQLYADKMISYMNLSADPCDDFYEYACGNYFNVNKPKLSIPIQSALSNIEDQEIDAFHQLLMEPTQNEEILSVADKVKIIYQACVNANVFDFKKSVAYLKLIEAIGGWPALDPDWKPENFNWFQVMTTLQQYGVNFLFNEEISYNRDYFVELKIDIFGLVDLFYENIDRTRSRPYQVNKKLAMKVMEIYGIPKVKAKIAFEEVLEFGRYFALEGWMYEYLKMASFNVKSLISILNLAELGEAYDWEKYFSSIAGDRVNTSESNLLLPPMSILEKIPQIFNNKNVLRGAANYAALKLLFELHGEFKSAKYSDRYCFFYVQKYLSTPASLIYSQSRYHSKANEDEVWTVLSYTRNALKDTVRSVIWLDEESKKRTVAKIENMKILIGYANLTWNLEKIEDEYKDLDVVPDDYYGNNLKLRRHHQKLRHKICTVNKSNKDDYFTPVMILVNAMYEISINKLTIPAVLLIKPFTYPELPKSYNFGSIGRIIGHEIVHGFDSTGKLFNEFVDLEEWWSNDSMKRYDEREQCFKNQYSSFYIPELHLNVNGEDTVDENIADNGGVRIAYHGYKKWLAEHEGIVDIEGESLRGLNLSNYQLFFLSYGQTYCTRYSSKKAYKLYVGGTYTVEKYRLLGSLSNFDEFSQHFNCKLGSRMNPDKKCILW